MSVRDDLTSQFVCSPPMRIGIVGNEACDADSLASAYIYAWAMNHIDPTNEYTPFMHCKVTELEFRLDFVEICKMCVIPLPSIHSLNEVTDAIEGWILVDHHFPSKLFQTMFPTASVLEVIDHHIVLSNEEHSFLATVPKVDIRTIGSTCTMIAERIFSFGLSVPTYIQKMLLLVIALDTGNLSTDLASATQADIVIYNSLKTKLEIVDMMPLFNQVRESRFSRDFWYNAPLTKILLYDFKDINRVGFSVVLRTLNGLADRDIVEFAQSMSYRIFVVSSGFLDEGQVKRELLVYFADDFTAMSKRLLSSFELELVSSTDPVARFRVLDVSFSRKKFAPKFLSLLVS